jgi:23S rRNA (pseudouridine1915-N3)-methyltransferase
MRITILAVGKLREKALLGLIAEYEKRLPPGMKIEWVESPAAKGEGKSAEIMAREAQTLRGRIPARARKIALSEKGKEMSSLEFSAWLGRHRNEGRDLCFLIGGPEGLDPALVKEADEVISLSRLTFPHDLVRLILAEQIYRAVSILRGEPYHRE